MSDEKLVFHRVPKGQMPDLGTNIQADLSQQDYRDGKLVFDVLHTFITGNQRPDESIVSLELDDASVMQVIRMGLWATRRKQLSRGLSDGWYDHQAQKVMENYAQALEGIAPAFSVGPIKVYVGERLAVREYVENPVP